MAIYHYLAEYLHERVDGIANVDGNIKTFRAAIGGLLIGRVT